MQVELCNLLLTLAKEQRSLDPFSSPRPAVHEIQQQHKEEQLPPTLPNGIDNRDEDQRGTFRTELDSVIDGVLQPEYYQMQRLLSSPRVPRDQVR
jgi:hypothetical protein